MNILVSACLLGVACRYDGCAKKCGEVEKLLERHHLVPVCPEQLGGLCTPRDPAERLGDRVITRFGRDVTEQYEKGAEEAVRLARLFSCEYAVLKERSPSCGCGAIYDGSFTGTLTAGDGMTAALLKKAGVKVMGESRVPQWEESQKREEK